jgi:hypothetical protein
MISLLVLQLLVLSADEPKWELSAEEKGFKIYGRAKAGSDVREMKAVGVMEASPQEIWSVVRDLDSYKRTMPYTEEAKVLSREKDDKVVLFYSRLNTPMVARRDYIIKLVDESDDKGNLKVSWSAVNDQDALMPVKDDIVRVRTNDGYWLLEPREEGKKTQVTYYIYTAPGGSIPTFIVNSANGIAVPKVFESIRTEVTRRREKTEKK